MLNVEYLECIYTNTKHVSKLMAHIKHFGVRFSYFIMCHGFERITHKYHIRNPYKGYFTYVEYSVASVAVADVSAPMNFFVRINYGAHNIEICWIYYY